MPYYKNITMLTVEWKNVKCRKGNLFCLFYQKPRRLKKCKRRIEEVEEVVKGQLFRQREPLIPHQVRHSK